MAGYCSSYTSSEIQERLEQGYYDDIIAAGIAGGVFSEGSVPTKAELDKKLAELLLGGSSGECCPADLGTVDITGCLQVDVSDEAGIVLYRRLLEDDEFKGKLLAMETGIGNVQFKIGYKYGDSINQLFTYFPNTFINNDTDYRIQMKVEELTGSYSNYTNSPYEANHRFFAITHPFFYYSAVVLIYSEIDDDGDHRTSWSAQLIN